MATGMSSAGGWPATPRGWVRHPRRRYQRCRDAHTGVLLAALSRGQTPDEAARRANAAAAIAVSRHGPATHRWAARSTPCWRRRQTRSAGSRIGV
ncbi:PfkB family carbohydrate kinase [Salinicola tamaricis]|uniref:PfkB family carbohydrate kinase n=1 Tax=Salinicola tamaricis TaxID=1771309 RepID=UPI003BF5E198